jgi:beta-galactosidase
MRHGSRRFYDYTSPKYLELSDRICSALAEHYKGNGQVIAWQLDNEFNCHMDVSYAPSDTEAFREWLREKYGSLEELNRAWGTAFWSQTYTDWEQIDLPAPTATYRNPTLLLDETRFISDCVVRFARRQAEILRRANPAWLITHNGLFSNVKGPDLVGELDFFSHDQYPLFYEHWTLFANNLVQARSLGVFSRGGGEAFAIMEQQAGPGGQMEYLHRTPRPGEMRLWAWQAMAHGARALCYFRWRTCPYGQEQHWHGLLDPDDRDNRRLAEAKRVAEEIRRVPTEFWETPVDRVVGVIRDFDNEANDRRINTYNNEGNWEGHRWVAEFAKRHVPADMVWADSPGEVLSGYRVIVAAHLRIVSADMAEKLVQFVRAGGTLVLCAQTGIKDENCHLVERPAPGLLRELAGVEVEDFTMVPGKGTFEARFMEDGEGVELGVFVERLNSIDCEVVASWNTEDSLLAGAAAITRRRFGEGIVYYVGGYLAEGAVGQMAGRILKVSGLGAVVQAPGEVEAVSRGAYVVLMNHSAAEQVAEGVEGTSVLDGQSSVSGGRVVLAPHGVALVKRT